MSIRKRLEAVASRLLVERERCVGCGAWIGAVQPTGSVLVDYEPDCCAECGRLLDQDGKPIMASMILHLGPGPYEEPRKQTRPPSLPDGSNRPVLPGM
ncbi:MAG: hypothetical protein LAT64_00980 [Phycisphaerales bacterium]|nr:hypothetical protein [Planctomycetota bacterium]MCH8507335.1 hypothetical protein [Phycisphaerales bacterium]